jgi:hypothetical protein
MSLSRRTTESGTCPSSAHRLAVPPLKRGVNRFQATADFHEVTVSIRENPTLRDGMAFQAALSTHDEERGTQENAFCLHLLRLTLQNALIEKHLNGLSVGFSRIDTVTPRSESPCTVFVDGSHDPLASAFSSLRKNTPKRS